MTLCSSNSSDNKSYHPLQEQGDVCQDIMDKRASPIHLDNSKLQNIILTPFYHPQQQQQDQSMNVPVTSSSSSFIPFEIPTPTSSSQYQYSTKKIVFNNQYQQNNNNNTSLGRPMTLFTTRPYKKYKQHTISEAPLPVEGLPRRYSCTVCGKKFVRPSSLTTHIYSHTGEKPFQCPVERCGRRFSVISNLRRHGKVHSSPTKKE